MMFKHPNYILFDDESWEQFLPFTFTRPVGQLRTGILTVKEKWDKYLDTNCSYLTREYLSCKFPLILKDINVYINGSVLPTIDLVKKINKLQINEALIDNTIVIAACTDSKITNTKSLVLSSFKNISSDNQNILRLKHIWELFTCLGTQIQNDFEILTSKRKSQLISKTNHLICPENIFFEEGAMAEYVTINAKTGPVFIGKHAEIMEGSVIRGPLALGEHSIIKLGSKIYGPTSIGPHCMVGGEVNNSVFIGYSNKGHDGFLGNSVIGEWCNLGADTNNSNLKNNYASVKLWNYKQEKFVDTALQFCGLFMGDHSKCGINTMFNTGTVVGVNANIYGPGFPRNFIPSFSWGGSIGFIVYSIDKAFEVAEKVMHRRDISFTEEDRKILFHIFELTKKYRNF